MRIIINILIFTLANFINVIISTIKSIVTINGSKFQAALFNAISYGYYTVIIILIATYNIDIITKCIIVFLCNFLGVYIVKYIDTKIHSNNLWVFECTVRDKRMIVSEIKQLLLSYGIKCIYDEIVCDKLYNLKIFSKNTNESSIIIDTLSEYDMKYYIIETNHKEGE